MKTIISPRFTMVSVEVEGWIRNTLMFLAPLFILIYFPFVTNNIQTDGFQLSDFLPNQYVMGAITLYVGNVITDFLKKYLPETKIVLPK